MNEEIWTQNAFWQVIHLNNAARENLDINPALKCLKAKCILKDNGDIGWKTMEIDEVLNRQIQISLIKDLKIISYVGLFQEPHPKNTLKLQMNDNWNFFKKRILHKAVISMGHQHFFDDDKGFCSSNLPWNNLLQQYQIEVRKNSIHRVAQNCDPWSHQKTNLRESLIHYFFHLRTIQIINFEWLPN